MSAAATASYDAGRVHPQGMLGHVHSEEAKAKMSTAHLGVPKSPETKAKMAEATRLSYENGRSRISPATGKTWSDETCDQISQTLKQRYADGMEHPRGMLGKTMSAESRAKMSASRTGHKDSPETKARKAEASRKREATKKAAREAAALPT